MIEPTEEHFNQYISMLYSFFNKNSKLKMVIGSDDFWQELCMSYLDACRKYDADRGSFSTLLNNNLTFTCYNLWKSYYKEKIKFSLNTPLDIDNYTEELINGIEDKEEPSTRLEKYGIVINEDLFTYLQNCVLQFEYTKGIINVDERLKIYKNWLNGIKIVDIAKQYKTKPQNISYIIKKFNSYVLNLLQEN